MFYVGDVPDIFKIADQKMRGENRNGNVKRQPRVKPMPVIKGNPSSEGPIKVTQELLDSWDKKKTIDKEEVQREYERSIIELLAKKSHLQSRLSDLDPKNKKDSRRIASINIQLIEIDKKLVILQNESGINIDHLETGSKIARFIKSAKKKVQKIWKKVKKLWRKYSDVIIGVMTVVIPSLITIMARRAAST